MTIQEFKKDICRRQNALHFQSRDFDKISLFNKGNFLGIEDVKFWIITCKNKEEVVKNIKKILEFMNGHISDHNSTNGRYYMLSKLLREIENVEEW